jgi:competence protein ComEA
MQELSNREKVLFAFVILSVLIIAYLYTMQQYEEPVMLNEPMMLANEIEKPNDSDCEEMLAEFMVDVKGEVKHPGVYVVKKGDRVIDVITKAGGFIDGANEQAVNLSAHLKDEMVIFVPKDGEQIVDSQWSSESEDKIDINKAKASLLSTLPGIGEAKANAIVQYRRENGPFKSIEDLLNVSGIGAKTLNKFRDQITSYFCNARYCHCF